MTLTDSSKEANKKHHDGCIKRENATFWNVACDGGNDIGVCE